MLTGRYPTDYVDHDRYAVDFLRYQLLVLEWFGKVDLHSVAPVSARQTNPIELPQVPELRQDMRLSGPSALNGGIFHAVSITA